jgi:hypothetical protein
LANPGKKSSKIHDKHLGAAQVYVDGLVEAIRDNDYCVRVHGMRDEVGRDPALPVNAGLL